MTTDTPQRSVLVFGASQRVLDDTVTVLRDLGYAAQGTNDFSCDITGRFDVSRIDLVSLGGQAFTAGHQDPARSPGYMPGDRCIRLSLQDPAAVKVTLWWRTALIPPDPKSDSLVLFDDRLPPGDHAIPVPSHIPPQAATPTGPHPAPWFATVQIGSAIYNLSIAAGQ